MEISNVINAVDQALPMAIGLMLSPFPVLALLIILMTANARQNSFGFMIGWFLGIMAVALLTFLVPAIAGGNREPSVASGWIRLTFGVLLLIGAVKQFNKRPGKGETPQIPRLIERLDRVGVGASLFTGFLLSGVNVKNLMFIAGGTLTIIQAPGAISAHLLAFVIFTLIGTLLLFLILMVYFVLGDKAQQALMTSRKWLTQHVYVVLAALLFFISAILLSQAGEILLP